MLLEAEVWLQWISVVAHPQPYLTIAILNCDVDFALVRGLKTMDNRVLDQFVQEECNLGRLSHVEMNEIAPNRKPDLFSRHQKGLLLMLNQSLSYASHIHMVEVFAAE